MRPAMSLRLLASSWFVLWGIAGTTLSQETLVNRLRPAFDAMPAGTEAWFGTGTELVEAHLQCDVSAAMATVERLWAVAETSKVPGARLAVAALAELVTIRREGPTAGAVWRSRAGEPPATFAARLRASFHLARARCLCIQGQHAEELDHVVPGQAAADESGQVLSRLRAGQMTLHLMPGRGHAWLKQEYEDALGGPEAAEVVTFEPWLLVDEHVELFGAGKLEESVEMLAKAEAAAVRDGNLRALILVSQYRGDHHFRLTEVERALACHEQAAATIERLGDRPLQASSQLTRAFLLVRLGDHDAALALLDEADAMVQSRGILGVDRGILELRLELAVRQRDGDRAAAIADELDAKAVEYNALERRLLEAKSSLLKAEREKEEAERQLQAASRQALDRARNQRAWLGAGITLALALITFVTWRSRRKLLVANVALAEQVQRVEAAQAAQARLEERMRELERSESLGTMAAGVAHDFNNLLTGILGNAEMLVATHGDAETVAAAEGIAAAGQQAARLCRQLQIYSGGAPLQQVPLNLVALVRSLLPVLRASVRDAVAVSLVCDRDSIGVLADRAQIEQVLLNLVVNAHDAKARSVRIVIEAGADTPSPMTRIEVTDDGEGMPQEVAQRVFDPFFTTRFPGRGLGLAVVYGVARRHGGSVAVTSAPGRGTTFTLRLPAVAAPAPVAEPIVVLPAMPPPTAAASVLIVDDDASVRHMLATMLRQLGREATAFADGPSLLAALAKVLPGDPVVLFVDLAMPTMDGCEVVRRARECCPDVRVVLMSGHDLAYVEQMAREVGPDHVLAKPFLLESLQASLVSALGRASRSAARA
jgi:signal transduction histidine kinase/ActR/RegA family two-component response regulator